VTEVSGLDSITSTLLEADETLLELAEAPEAEIPVKAVARRPVAISADEASIRALLPLNLFVMTQSPSFVWIWHYGYVDMTLRIHYTSPAIYRAGYS
jgi:hypothetical protein